MVTDAKPFAPTGRGSNLSTVTDGYFHGKDAPFEDRKPESDRVSGESPGDPFQRDDFGELNLPFDNAELPAPLWDELPSYPVHAILDSGACDHVATRKVLPG